MAHIDYHAILRAGEHATSCCPVCSFLATAEEQYFQSMLYSWIGTEGFQDRFLSHDGFCTRHRQRFAQHGDGVAAAMLYGPLMTHRRRWMKELRSPSWLRFVTRHRSKSLAIEAGRRAFFRGITGNVQGDCPVCIQRRHWEVSFLTNLSRHGSGATPEAMELREVYTRGPGLCMPHYAQLCALRLPVPPWLAAFQEAREEAVYQELEQYITAIQEGRRVASGAPWQELLSYMEGWDEAKE